MNVVSYAATLQTLNGNYVNRGDRRRHQDYSGIRTIYSVPFNTSRRQPGTWEVFTLAG